MNYKMNTSVLIPVLMATMATLAMASTGDKNVPLNALNSNYLAIQTELASDSTESITKNALSIQKIALNVGSHSSGNEAKLGNAIAKAADAVAKTKTLEESRSAFRLLSKYMIEYQSMIPGNELKVAHCPMAKASWLQTSSKISNPYYGSSMLRCGSFVTE